MKFKNFSLAVAEDKKFAEYIAQAKLGSANRGGVFVGSYEVAPTEFRRYGIILPKGGMILPEADLREAVLFRENYRPKMEAEKAAAEVAAKAAKKEESDRLAAEWLSAINSLVVPEVKARLKKEGVELEVTSYASGSEYGEPYCRLTIEGIKDGLGYDGSVLNFNDGPNVAKALQFIERRLGDMRQLCRDRQFLSDQTSRVTSFKEVMSQFSELKLCWTSWPPGSVKLPDGSEFVVYHREEPAASESGGHGELIASTATPEDLVVACEKFAASQTARLNAANAINVLRAQIGSANILLLDCYADSDYHDSQYCIMERPSHLEFNCKNFLYTEVEQLRSEVEDVVRRSEAYKSDLRRIAEAGGEPEKQTWRNPKNDRNPYGSTSTSYTLNGKKLSGAALQYMSAIKSEVERRRKINTLEVEISIYYAISRTKGHYVFEGKGPLVSTAINARKSVDIYDQPRRGFHVAVGPVGGYIRRSEFASGREVVEYLNSLKPEMFV